MEDAAEDAAEDQSEAEIAQADTTVRMLHIRSVQQEVLQIAMLLEAEIWRIGSENDPAEILCLFQLRRWL